MLFIHRTFIFDGNHLNPDWRRRYMSIIKNNLNQIILLNNVKIMQNYLSNIWTIDMILSHLLFWTTWEVILLQNYGIWRTKQDMNVKYVTKKQQLNTFLPNVHNLWFNPKIRRSNFKCNEKVWFEQTSASVLGRS